MRYRFGEFFLDTDTEELIGPDGPVALRRRAYLLLRSLLEHAPALVSRQQILDEVWGHDALTANVLPQAIGEIRQALGDRAQDPHLIETRHGRGYRIKVAVQAVAPAANPDPVPEVQDDSAAAPTVAAAIVPASAPAPAPAKSRWRYRLLWVLAPTVLLALVLAFAWPHPKAPPTGDPPRPSLALALSTAGDDQSWLHDAGVELLAVALAADDRVHLLRSDGRRGSDGGRDSRWQIWLREGLGADLALTGIWDRGAQDIGLSYSLVRLADARVVHAGTLRDADLATLCRSVARELRQHLRLIPANEAWLSQLPAQADARASYYQGLAHLAQGDAGNAVTALELAAADERAGARVQRALASAYRISGRLSDARAQFQLALAASDSFDLGERLRIEAEAALTEHQSGAAIAALRTLQRLLPDDREVLMALADAHLRARQSESAASLLDRNAWASANADPRWLLLRARIAQAESEPKQAVELATEAARLAQQHGLADLAADALLERATGLRASGDLAGARTQLEALRAESTGARVQAEAAAQLGSLQRDLGDFAAAGAELEAAQAAYEQLGDHAGVLRMRIEQHVIASERGHNEQAYRTLLELDAEVAQLDDPLLLSRYFNTLGVQAARNREPEAAQAHLQRSASEARRARQPKLEAGAYTNLGQVLVAQGRPAEAESVWEQALLVFRDQGDALGQGITLSNLAAVASSQGQLARSRDLNREALIWLRQVNASQHLARTAFNQGLAAERMGALDEASERFEEALSVYRQGAAGDPVLNVAAALLRVRLQRAEIESAQVLLDSLAEALESVRNPLPRSHVLAQAAALATLKGDFAASSTLQQQVLQLRQQAGQPGWIALTELELLGATLTHGAGNEHSRAQAERIGEQMRRLSDVRGRVRAGALEATALIALGRKSQASILIEQGYEGLAGHQDHALALELDRLRILASDEPAAATRARLLQLADELESGGMLTLALRLRLDADPDQAGLQQRVRELGLIGLLPRASSPK